MSFLHCDRCGELFGTDGLFMTADVAVIGGESRAAETLTQTLLCPSCTRAIGDALSLETTVHDHS